MENTSNTGSGLAVVIPAFRAQYFAAALDSLVAQTDKNFRVYVGDDCSPENLLEIVERYSTRLDISYTRFPDNIGAKNLVAQWNRCIDLVADGDWLWIFSDDDLADPRCVECFHECLREPNRRFDVYRFNTLVIDRHSKVIAVAPVGPEQESSAEMAYHLLHGKRGNSMPDHIFRRSAVERNKGFIFTEYAQAADWASSIFFSSEAGIRVIPGANVRWRVSGTNISSVARFQNEMVVGHLQFLAWLLDHFQPLRNVPGPISYDMMRQAALVNFRTVIVSHYGGLRFGNNSKGYRFLRTVCGLSIRGAVAELAVIYAKSSPRIKSFARVARALTKR